MRRLFNSLISITICLGLISCGSDIGDSRDNNTAPVIQAFTDLSIKENTRFSFIPSFSDNDQDAVFLRTDWKQLSGPVVYIDNIFSHSDGALVFQAPSVNEDTSLTFELSVKDSQQLESKRTLLVTVEANINLAPSITALTNDSIKELSQFTLTPTYEDSDGWITSKKMASNQRANAAP
jgi:hypothetical protein